MGLFPSDGNQPNNKIADDETEINHLAQMKVHSEVVVTDIIFPTPHWGGRFSTKSKKLFELVKKWKRKGVIIPFFINPKQHLYVVRFDQTIELFASKEIYRELLALEYEHEIVLKTGGLNDHDF